MIDTHCHLTDPRLNEQLDAVLLRAQMAGVDGMVTIGTGLDDDLEAIEVCQYRPQLRCAVGVHPNYVNKVDFADLPKLAQYAKNPAVVALGEIGLDYHHDECPPKMQRRFFEWQLQLAQDTQMPVIIHNREATEDTLSVLSQFKLSRAVFHCFTGSINEANRILDAGFWLGFTGPITFKKNDELREVVRTTPINRLLVETDAPYLTPEPMRKQKTNEPSMVIHTARMVAQIKDLSETEVDKLTTDNARRFFSWV